MRCSGAVRLCIMGAGRASAAMAAILLGRRVARGV